ncbi:hypothetical protein DLAC_06969 [Tieghemostelium lacteum]|uniref:ditrans,polycis-polyprenyl diphosphate synthase [(2E,6E)-farnesyldiphosphate specific] n=1 Tax=Tieghemostelium lacteum TaxID=361077 RepID=A0A151ZDU5_TIELA|nr:hypothetical protein DLAC_06969 [Tieghemostelium lacteum]|eukprot:KYQ92128.1 hypothetical protein DLAC_06969 [Tieghemostelium lacteum]
MIVQFYHSTLIRIKSMISQTLMHLSIRSPTDYVQYIVDKQHQYKNISTSSVPRHLVIILNHDDQIALDTSGKEEILTFYNKLSDIILWSIIVEIPRITIFDNHGSLKHQHFSTFKSILEDKSKIVLNNNNILNWLNLKPNNATVNSNIQPSKKINISIASIDDGKQELINITKKFINENLNNNNYPQIDEKYINSNLPYHLSGDNFEPEVALDFSEKYLFSGFLPWHIKLTEFIKVDYFHQFYLERYLQFLNSYCCIQKRFGK